MGHVQTSRIIPAAPDQLFAYLTDLHNVPEQMAGRLQVEFPSSLPDMRAQAEFELMLTRFSVATRFVGRVEQFVPAQKFSYRQLSGFFRAWSHVMLLDEHAKGQTRLTDIVEFTMPGGLFGALAEDLFVRQDVERLLMTRYERLIEHFSHDRQEKAEPAP